MASPPSGRRVVSSANIGRLPRDVYEYVTTPANWPQWHPSSLRVSGAVDHSLEIGEQCTEEYVVAGRRGTCVWTVVERDAPSKWSIAATTTDGGSAAIGYMLSAAGDGTRFVRTMTYAMPNWFYAMLDALVLRGRIKQESDEAVTRLKMVLEGGASR